MPIIKSAKKKLRQDVARRQRNVATLNAMRSAVKKARTSPTAKNIQEAYSRLDKAAKKRVIHKNKAARLKAALTRKMTTKKPKAVSEK